MTPHISAVVSSTTTSPPCDVMWDKVVSVHDHHVPPYVIGIGASLCCPLCLHYFLPIGMETPAQNLFNGMLVNGRSIVVEAIALLKGRWKILQDLNTKIQFSLLCLKEGQSYLASFGKHKVMRLRKGAKFPMAAISEDLIKTTLIVHAEKLVQFKVRAVVTMRNKMKEDFKETILKHFDAINNRIGTRNIVLDADYQHQD
ncbi:hypothetical protein JHK82_047979 [Glycine max]|nr:hypothetical protein JHK82_047979 [Glycine max]